MPTFIKYDVVATAQVIDFVTHIRSQCLSRREWKHRLEGHGYAIRETAEGDYIETLPHHVRICALPAELQCQF